MVRGGRDGGVATTRGGTDAGLPVRVLLITDFFPPVRGGLESHVDDLSAELSRRGHEVHVATLTTDPEPRDPAVTMHTIRTTSSRLVRHVDGERPFAPPVPDWAAARALADLVTAVEPDVVHSHTWLGVSLRRRRGTPLVVTAHEYSLVCQLRTLLRTDGERCSGPALAKCVACGSRRYGLAKSALLTGGTIAGRRLLHPDAVITLSRRVRTAIAGSVGPEIDVIPGFVVQPGPGSNAVQPPLPDVPYVMYAGDPGDHKGLPTLLNAWSALQPSGATLLIAPTKPLDLAVPPGVVVQPLTRQEVMQAWQRAEAAVVPSLWDEPFGMVAVEALTAGTPVVASAVGALPEIVDDDSNGLLVAPGDREGLQRALGRVLRDRALRDRLAAGAVRSARRYSPDAVIPEIEAVYDRVRGARHRRGGTRSAAG